MYILTPWNAEIWLQLGFSFPAGLLPCPAKLKLPSRPAMRSWCTGIGNHHREFGQLLFEGIVFLNRPKMMQTSKFVSRMLCTISVSSSPCSTVWLLNPHTHFRTWSPFYVRILVFQFANILQLYFERLFGKSFMCVIQDCRGLHIYRHGLKYVYTCVRIYWRERGR